MKTRLLVDGVFVQRTALDPAAIGRFSEVLGCVLTEAKTRDIDVAVLDRGGMPPIAGGDVISFPSYKVAFAAADSKLLQCICDWLEVDVFISTGFTTALMTPTVQLIADSSRDHLGDAEQASSPDIAEQQIAIAQATGIVHFPDPVRAKPSADVPHIEDSCTLDGSHNSVLVTARRLLDLACEVKTHRRDEKLIARWVELRLMQAAVTV